jgi:hypothetical protein
LPESCSRRSCQMIWTGRYDDPWGKSFRLGDGLDPYAGTDPYSFNRWTLPRWSFPLIRKDHLEDLLQHRYCGDGYNASKAIWPNIPCFEERGASKIYSYYDLRIVARFAPRATLPSIWRCSVCNEKVFRRWFPTFHFTMGEQWECSWECFEIAQKRAESARKKQRREYIDALRLKDKRRKREWQKIKECRELLKQARKLLREPNRAVSDSPYKESKPVTTSPTS